MLNIIVNEEMVDETVRNMKDNGQKVTSIAYADGKAYIYYW